MFEVLNHLIDGRAGHMGGTAMARTVEKAGQSRTKRGWSQPGTNCSNQRAGYEFDIPKM